MVRLPRAIHDEIVAHALDDEPNEACGLLAGRGDEVTRLFRGRNKERSPVRYEIDPRDLVQMFRAMCDSGLEHVGIYHSHTRSPAYPSPTDIRLAYYPDALYFIVSLMDKGAPLVRAFWIRDGTVREEPIELLASAPPGSGAVRLPRSIRDEMAAHAVEGYPYEVCGLLAGRDNEVTHSFRARNKERSPVRYAVEDADLLRIFREIDDADLELLGIYHSHVHTLARPSATDIRQATYPDALYFIVSLVDERPPYVREEGGIRAYRIRDGQVAEEQIEIVAGR